MEQRAMHQDRRAKSKPSSRQPPTGPVGGLQGSMLHLQATAGNRAVAGLLAQRAASADVATGDRVTVQPWNPFSKSKPHVPQISAPTAPVAGPSLAEPATADIALKGKEREEGDPAGALAVHAAESGELLKATQRHDTKIERYSRFFEADAGFVAGKRESWSAARLLLVTMPDGKAKTQKAKEIATIEKEVGGQPDAEMPGAKERIDLASQAQAASDKEVPLVDGVYEEARRVAAKAKAETGGRSIQHTRGRLAANAEQVLRRGGPTGQDQYKGRAKDDAGVAKHEGRMTALGSTWKAEAARIGRLVQQAKLSEGVLFVKRSQLKAGKAAIKAKGRSVGLLAHLTQKGKTTLASAALSTATLGLFTVKQEKTDGGYTSKRTIEPIWARLRGDLDRMDNLLDKRPYGAANSLHAVLDLMSGLTREVRNVFASIALLSTLLSLIPGAAAVFAPVAGFCTVFALGLTAAKLVMDTVLASWSVVTRALNSNARNDDLLTSQSVRQGGDVVGGALAMTGAFTAPMAGNALHPGHYHDPLQQASSSTFASHAPEAAAPSLLSDPGGAAMAGLTKLGSRAPGVGVGLGARVATEGFGAVTSFETVSAGHFAEGERARNAGTTPAGRSTVTVGPKGPRPAEPAWMAKARGEEASARAATVDTLLTMHAAQLRRLHGKTQSLAADNKGGAAKAHTLGQVLEKAGKDDAAGQSGIIAEASERLDTTLSGTAELLAESADPKVLAESPGSA